MDIALRVFIKLFLWLIFFIFILVYVVLGYRYYDNVGLIRANSTFTLYFPVESGEVLINERPYKFLENKLNFYSVYKWIYWVKYKNSTINFFISDSDYREFFIFSDFKVKTIDKDNIDFDECKKSKKDNVLYIICWSKYKVYFEKIKDKLFVCDNKFVNCDFVLSFSGILLGHRWFDVYFLSWGKIYRLSFK